MKRKSGHGFSLISGIPELLEVRVGPHVLAVRSSGTLGTSQKTSFKDIKTRGDEDAQRMIYEDIRRRFSHHSIRGEESGDASQFRGTSEIEYIVDPIDGTSNYAGGSPFFGVSVGVARRGVPVAGVIHFPAMGVTLEAEIGRGAFLNGQPLIMPEFSGDSSELLVSGDFLPGTEKLFQPLKDFGAIILMFSCFTVSARFVAEGILKCYVHTGATPFDVCASIAIVREAGGVAVGIRSNEIDLSSEKIPIILASNMDIVREVRRRFDLA